MFKRLLIVFFCTIIVVLLVSPFLHEIEARVGGGSSLGSRGSRSLSMPTAPPSQSNPYQQTLPHQTPSPYQSPQPYGGGFFRNMAGGMVGGLLGGMLFRSLGFGGMGGGGGILELLLIGGVIYFVFRLIKSKQETNQSSQSTYSMDNYRQPSTYQSVSSFSVPPSNDLATGLSNIRQFDPSFDEQRFCDNVMDIFFKIQSAWMNRDLSLVSNLLTSEIRGIFQNDIDKLFREKRINKLENIAVRKVEISEAWQESGQDYITTLIYANLLDYTTDDTTGQIVDGSKTDPVKFEEFWTFTRSIGSNQWQLSAINQK